MGTERGRRYGLLQRAALRLNEAVGNSSAKPRTYPSSGNRKSATELFSKRDRSIKELESLEVRYLQGGPVREAVDSYAHFALSNGFYLDGNDEAAIKDTEAGLDDVDIEDSFWQGIVDAVVFGDGFQELVSGSGLMADRIVKILPRASKMFDIATDEYGIKTGYIQYKDSQDLKGLPLDLEQILNVSFFHVGGSKYGVSIMQSAKDDIDRDVQMIDSLLGAIERHGHPRYHAKVGSPDEDVPQIVLDKVAEQLHDLKSSTELATCQDVNIVSLDASGVGNTTVYSDLTSQRMFSALGVPGELVGFGRSTSTLSQAAKSPMQNLFEMKIGYIHDRLERIYNPQVIDRLNGKQKAVKLIFNDVSPEDELKEAEYVAKVLQADPVSPIVGPQWARKRLKITEEDAP